jgi:hypothetical protein
MTPGTPLSLLRSLGRFRPSRADQRLHDWQENWRRGAEARWSSQSTVNPHPAGSDRAAAWIAGWDWAERRPNRRETTQSRLAHPHRRSTDTLPQLVVRHARAGAIGISAVTLLGGLWAIRRRRSRAG